MEEPEHRCGCTSNEYACGDGIHLNDHFVKLCTILTRSHMALISDYPALYLDTLESSKGLCIWNVFIFINQDISVKFRFLPILSLDSKTMECWNTAYGGTALAAPYRIDNGFEQLAQAWMLMKEMVSYRVGVNVTTIKDRKDRLLCSDEKSMTVNVLIQNKREGKRIIDNLEDVRDWTVEHKIHNLKGFNNLESYDCKSFATSTTEVDINSKSIQYNVTFISWEDFPILADQLKLLTDADIFITSPGAGSINSIFLAEGSVMITSPFCEHVKWCDQDDLQAMFEHLSNFETFIYPLDIPINPREVLTQSNTHTCNTHFIKEKYKSLLEEATYSMLYQLIPV